MFSAILVVEGVILIFSVQNFERTHLLELEREALVVMRAIVRSAGAGGDLVSELPKTGRLLRDNSVLVGARLFDESGVKIAEFGERPAPFGGAVPNTEKTIRQEVESELRLDVLWPPHRVRAPYFVLARIDISDTNALVGAFIWRIVGLIFLISVFVTIVTMLVLRTMILAPIMNLSDRMVAAASDPGNPRKYILTSPSTDEWGSVVEFFNALLRRTAVNLGRLEKQEKVLQSQLHQAQKMEAIGQLTSGVAHDFNNLLMIVLGNAELLEDAVDEKAAKLVRPVIRAALRGSELTQRLLSFSRRQPQKPVAVDLGALVSGLGALLSHTLSETVELEVRTSDDLWSVVVDPGQMENALLNLAFNAQHAMPEGGKLVIEAKNVSLDADDVSKHGGARSGDYALIVARDTGSGIPPEVLEHVFEPFFTTKEAGEGTGLGLSMVHDFVTQSGGYVALDSLLGEGTEIRLYFPCAPEDPAETEAVPVRQASPRGDRQRVLVVEDDPDVRELTVAMLDSLGYAAVAAETGLAGLEILRDDLNLDVLLSDTVLAGGMSGVELIAEARRRVPGLRIVLMSGHADSTPERHRLPEHVAVLDKPFNRQDLSLKLRASLGAPE